MSSTIDVYAVSLETLSQAVGSRDQALIDEIVATQQEILSVADEIDDEAGITCADALGGLVKGEIAEDGPGYLYGYAVQALCAHLGRELLPNVWGIAGAADWIAAFDATLEQRSVPLRLASLVYGGSPVPIPTPDDYPFIGCWPAGELAPALEALKAFDVLSLDEEMAETVGTIRKWLEVAVKLPGAAIVGFLS